MGADYIFDADEDDASVINFRNPIPDLAFMLLFPLAVGVVVQLGLTFLLSDGSAKY